MGCVFIHHLQHFIFQQKSKKKEIKINLSASSSYKGKSFFLIAPSASISRPSQYLLLALTTSWLCLFNCVSFLSNSESNIFVLVFVRSRRDLQSILWKLTTQMTLIKYLGFISPLKTTVLLCVPLMTQNVTKWAESLSEVSVSEQITLCFWISPRSRERH